MVDRIVERVLPLPFDRVYSHFPDLQIETDGKDAIRRSAEYLAQQHPAMAPTPKPSHMS